MIELLDVLDASGAPTGRVKAKDEVHRDGDWHRSAHLWIASAERSVLLQRRAFVKASWPGLWDISIAGHVDAGETAVEAVIREAFEELGLVVRPEELRHLGTLRYQATYGAFVENEYHDVFLSRRELDLATLTLDPAEVAEVAWVRWEELESYERVPHPDEYALLGQALLSS